MEHFVEILKDQVQIVAIAFMATVYLIRIIWLFRFTAAKESTPARGSHGLGIASSLLNIFAPWSMQSYSKHKLRYLEFGAFHIGLGVTIAATVVIPYWPQVMTPEVVLVCRALIAAAFLAGLSRLIRRISKPEMRIISSKDDYFSLIVLEVFLVTGFLGVANNSMWATIAFFGITTFFLVYVPFSKISHYIYYPFNKYYVGKHLGHRGVLPKSYQETHFKA